MKEIPGTRPSEIHDLVRAEDRLSFVYLERCTIHRDANAITAILSRCAKDIRALLLPTEPEDDQYGEVLNLWDGGSRKVAAGANYEDEMFDEEVPW